MDFMYIMMAFARSHGLTTRLGGIVGWKALALFLLAAAAVFLLPETARAQQGRDAGYVDLVLLQSYGQDSGSFSMVRFIVANNGTATASGVTVSFLLEDLEVSTFQGGAGPTTTKSGANQSFTWEVGTLAPGGSTETDPLTFSTKLHSVHASQYVIGTYRIGVINATASSLQPEPDILLANNSKKIYSYANSKSGATLHMQGSTLALVLAVDDLHPAAGGVVDFDLTAQNLNEAAPQTSPFVNIIDDISISVELSNGLKFDDTQPAGLVQSGSQAATWRPQAIDKKAHNTIPESRKIENIKARLTSHSLEEIPLEERCITVRVADSKPPPSSDYALGRLKQCLGDDAPVLFDSGGVELMSVYPCVGITPITYPCRDENNDSNVDHALEMVSRVNPLKTPEIRSDGIGRIDEGSATDDFRAILRPKSVFVQVKDDIIGRNHDGSNLSWVTYNLEGDIFLDNSDLSSSNTWPKILWSISSVQLPTGGHLGIGPDANRSAQYINTDNKPNFPASGTLMNMPSAFRTALSIYIKFGALGTYVVDFTQKNSHFAGGVTSEVSATGRYTFHVGPVAELEARDGGRNAAVPAGQRAHTITVVNNGPDTAPAVEVTLKGVPSGATESRVSQGSYDDATGVWTIGELESVESRRLVGQHDGVTLTLTGAAAGTEITATVANTQDYEVCIDSSAADVDAASESACTGGGNTWHTAKYYDYKEDNSKDVTIKARPGGGGTALRTSQDTTNIGLSWSPWGGATAYGVEVSEDDGATWGVLERWVSENSYTHTMIPVGAKRHYRVHAIDDEGVRGLPFARASAVAGRSSQQASPPGAPEQMTLVATPLSREEIVLSWVKPEDYGSDITRYTLQVADGSGGPWRNVDPQPGVDDVGYDYRGLQPNTLKYFRIRAANEFGGGAWSAVANARTVAAGVPGPPRNVSANASGENAISVGWDAPENDEGSPVTQYQVQAASSESGPWGNVGSVSSTENRSIEHTGLAIGSERYYRVRARNAAGWGPWSLPPYASATTVGGEPLEDYPSMWAEPAGHDAILISWLPPSYTGGRDITRYELQWFKSESNGSDCDEEGSAASYTVLRRPSVSERSYTHTGLRADQTYCYRLKAGTVAVWSEWAVGWATTESGATPGTPSLTVQAAGAEEIKVSWTKPSDGGSRITHYDLEWAADPAEHSWYWVERDGLSAGATSYTDAGLGPGTERHYRLRAHNENGPGRWSVVRGATTVAGGPERPGGVTATAHDTNQRIDVSWTEPDNTGGSAITGYWVERSRTGDGPWERVIVGNRTTYSDTSNLYPGMRRHYRVAAVNRSGAGLWSDSVESDATAIPAGGSAATAPPAPGLLRFTGVGPDWVSLTWDRPADGGAPITGYQYQETLSEETFTTTSTSATIRGLDDGLSFYSFWVRALNAVGEGKWSDDVYTTLWPDRSEQVRVSPTTITVNEDGTARFTVSLNRAPPLPVRVGVYPRGDRANELLYDAYRYSDKVLIPSGWSHPDGDDWSERVHNWSSGVPVAVQIGENPVTGDEAAVIDVEVSPLSHHELGITADEWDAKWGVTPGGDTEWDRATYRSFTGPSVKITVRNSNSN